MSNFSNSPLNKKEYSLVSRAMQEFNKVTQKNEASDDNDNLSTRKGANPPKKRSVLGRGLSALMSPTTTVDIQLNNQTVKEQNTSQSIDESTSIKAEIHSQLANLPIDQLVPNPHQPRTSFDQKEIRELASSIRKSGILQPLLVRKKSNTHSAFSSYEIVAGERRWRAAKEAGLISVPAIVKEFDDQETLEIGIIENIQRQDLNPIEEALAYTRLMNEFGSTQEQLSQVFGKDRSSISNTMRLLNLPEEIQTLLKERKLSAGHARALLALENKEEQIELANILSKDKLSVREAEKLVVEIKSGNKDNLSKNLKTVNSSSQNKDLEERIRRALGTKVKVNMLSNGKGDVKISFFSKAEFDNFIEKIGA